MAMRLHAMPERSTHPGYLWLVKVDANRISYLCSDGVFRSAMPSDIGYLFKSKDELIQAVKLMKQKKKE